MRMSPKRRVALLVAGRPDRRAVVGDQHEVDLGHLLPGRGGLGELLLPDAGAEPGIERRLEVAGHAADARPVGDEAVGDADGVGPLRSGGGVEQAAGPRAAPGRGATHVAVHVHRSWSVPLISRSGSGWRLGRQRPDSLSLHRGSYCRERSGRSSSATSPGSIRSARRGRRSDASCRRPSPHGPAPARGSGPAVSGHMNSASSRDIVPHNIVGGFEFAVMLAPVIRPFVRSHPV